MRVNEFLLANFAPFDTDCGGGRSVQPARNGHGQLKAESSSLRNFLRRG
jgi:hypothetical protein